MSSKRTKPDAKWLKDALRAIMEAHGTQDLIIPLIDGLGPLWEKQNGKCALSGRDLGDDVELDFPPPDSGWRPMGFDFNIDYCQLTTPEAKRARGTMMNKDFIALCVDVVRHQSLCEQTK